MPNNYYYEPTTAVTSTSTFTVVWTIVSLILAVVGGLVVYYLFIKPDKEVKDKFLDWLKEFFNFKKMLVEDLLKIIYLMLTIFITLFSFNFITANFFTFLLLLVFGNIFLRLMFELSLINIMIWKNTTEINKKMKK